MLQTTAKQKFALRKNRENLQEIYEMYWKHETYLHGGVMKKRFIYTVKEIWEKYEMESAQELIFLLLQTHKTYAGTCLFCKEDYFTYEIRSGERSTYCGCKGICKECNQPYSNASHNYVQTCSSCSWKKDNSNQRQEEEKRDSLQFIAFNADHQSLMFYVNENQIEEVILTMKKRIKFLKSHLKFRDSND